MAGRTLAFILALLAGTLADEAAAAPRQLTIGITQFPSNFHPNIDSMMAKKYVLSMAQRPFTAYDPDWELVCMLCTELPTLENGLAEIEPLADGGEGIALTYTIQPDATWGDGTPVTTDDVLFTLEVGKHPESGVTNAELYRRILEIDVVDDKTFVMHVDRVTFEYNAINDFELIPAHLERARFEADPSTYRNRTLFDTDTTNPGLWFGPYKITAVAPGASVTLEPNPTFYGEAPYFERIVVKAIENTAALEANLLSGSIDMIPGEVGLTVDQALAFEKRHGDAYRITYKPGLVYEHVDLMLDDPVLADRRVRQALILGLDRQALSEQLFEGRQPVAHTSVSPLDWVHADDIPHYEEDLERAAALLDEAGYADLRNGIRHGPDGRRLAFTLMTTAGNRSRELVEQVLQSQWKRLGIEVRIENEPARVFFGETTSKRRFDHMAMFAWISSPENVPRSTLHSEEIPSEANGWSGQNYTGFKNAEMDQLLEDIERELDREKRKAMWRRIQEIYASELPALPLYFRADAHVWPLWLEGVVPTGHQDPSTLRIETWHAADPA
ncbi:MAG TPA: peptide ABC transporter substrate-binding protein [Geminicoccaceae bacterium]